MLPCGASSVPVKRPQERKRKKAAAVKRHMKRLSRDEAKRKRLY
jgi:small subunit ribosomal protein S21